MVQWFVADVKNDLSTQTEVHREHYDYCSYPGGGDLDYRERLPAPRAEEEVRVHESVRPRLEAAFVIRLCRRQKHNGSSGDHLGQTIQGAHRV